MALADFYDDVLQAEYGLLELGAAIVASVERNNAYRTAMRRPRPTAWWLWRARVWGAGDA